MQLPRVGAVHRAGCDGACGTRVGALPPYMALFPSSNGDADSCPQLAQFLSSDEQGQSQPSISSATSSLHKGSQAGPLQQSSWIQADSQPGFHLWFCCFCLWWEREQGNSLARHFIGTGVQVQPRVQVVWGMIGKVLLGHQLLFFLLLPLRLGIGKCLPFCSCCFCPVWSGSIAEVMGGVNS